MDNNNGRISANFQRQEVSIAVFEPACWDPSPEGLARTVLSTQTPVNQKPTPPSQMWAICAALIAQKAALSKICE